MRKILFLVLLVFAFYSCNNNFDEVIDNNAIDENILGTWRVVYSLTKDSVMIGTDSLIYINLGDTIQYEYDGGEGKVITSYMFGDKENIIEIKDDNKIKVYFLNNRGGITITNDYIYYHIVNDLLIYHNGTANLYHHYWFEQDTLIIERIPDARNSWRYKLSKYKRIDDIQ